jgi:CBS domain-containing protein
VTAPTAKDVMNREVLGVRADMTSREAAAFLIENHIGGAPVLDGEGRLVGVLSLTDIAESGSDRPDPGPEAARSGLDVRGWRERPGVDLERPRPDAEDALVRDIMTPTVYTVPESTAVPEIARAMIAGRIHRLFVTRARKVVGIVTPLDLLRLLAGDAPAGARPAARAAGRRSRGRAARSRP